MFTNICGTQGKEELFYAHYNPLEELAMLMRDQPDIAEEEAKGKECFFTGAEWICKEPNSHTVIDERARRLKMWSECNAAYKFLKFKLLIIID